MLDPTLRVTRPREFVLHTMTFSTITFASSKLNVACNWLASTDGALRIKGIAALVRRDVTSSGCMEHLMLNKDACGANAPAKIKRTDFNTGTSAPDVSLRTARFAVFLPRLGDHRRGGGACRAASLALQLVVGAFSSLLMEAAQSGATLPIADGARLISRAASPHSRTAAANPALPRTRGGPSAPSRVRVAARVPAGPGRRRRR